MLARFDGLKLVGFSVWERRNGAGRNVKFPARQYSVNGERRSFALLRPIGDAAAQDVIREAILEAYAEAEANGLDRTRVRKRDRPYAWELIWGSRGRGFESRHPDHFLPKLLTYS